MPRAVGTQSLGSAGVAVNFPVRMKPQGTSLLQVQEQTQPAFHPHCWPVHFGNLAWEERQIVTFTLPLTQSRRGWVQSGNVLVALQLLLGLLDSGHRRAMGRKQMLTSGVSPPSPTSAFLISLLQLLPASLSCLIGVINEGVSHPLTRQAYILGLMTLILLMLSLSPFNCFISGVTAGSHLTSDKSQAPAD